MRNRLLFSHRPSGADTVEEAVGAAAVPEMKDLRFTVERSDLRESGGILT